MKVVAWIRVDAPQITGAARRRSHARAHAVDRRRHDHWHDPGVTRRDRWPWSLTASGMPSRGWKLCSLQYVGCCIGSSARAASKLKASGRQRIAYTREAGWRCGPCLDRPQTDHQPAAPKRKAPPAQAGPFERTPQLRGSGRKRVTEDERIVGDFHAGSTPPPHAQRRGGKGSSPKK